VLFLATHNGVFALTQWLLPRRPTAGDPHPSCSTKQRVVIAAIGVLATLTPSPLMSEVGACLHYGANSNFAADGSYLPGSIGLNLADVSSVSQLDSLPQGVKGLVWIGQCNGVDRPFMDAVQPYVGHSKLFGFYLMDEPDPTGKYQPLCVADNLKAEADFIHASVPGAKTFVLLMNMSSSKTPSFIDTYNFSNSHIDLFGIAPYPCRTELNGCDYEMVDHYVAAAEVSGIPRSSMVPVYQTFGGGNWVDDGGGQFSLPTLSQEQEILARWNTLLATPVFDFAYSWGSQNGDVALEASPDLQMLFAQHNSPARCQVR
jgi:hypothetical protein